MLSTALADTAEASTYRVTTYSALKLKLPALGIDSAADLDDERPLLVGEVSPEREHFTFDLGVVLEPLIGDTAEFAGLGFEMWVDDERMVMDTTSYGHLTDTDPQVDLGPIAPGVFSVDLAAIGAESPELQAALVGSSTPDLSELALRLPAALGDIEQTSTDPQVFLGTAIYADLLEAQGADLEDTARGAASSVALVQSMSVDALTDLYVEFYENLEAEVVVELDERGLLRVLSTRTDMSAIFSKILEAESLFTTANEEELKDARKSIENAEMILENRTVYEADIELEVPPPPATSEDRTEEWREFMISAGFQY